MCIIPMTIDKERKRVCCNCGNNIRIKDDDGNVIRCECEIDGHWIGYIACFEHWCRRWKKDRKWDNLSEEQ